MRARWGVGALVAVVAGVALVASAGEPVELTAPGRSAAVTRMADAAGARAPCSRGGVGTTRVDRVHDVVVGPLVLLGARRWAAAEPDGFDGHGYKVPVTLPEGVAATLSVAEQGRRRAGLVYTHQAQDRVRRTGVRGADRSVRFTACPADGAPGRTGWPGGLVVDRPRCVTLVVEAAGGSPVRRRVALGRRC